jgi:methionyl-tRNA formyltransferase
MGAALLRAALPDWMAGRLVASPQPDTGVTYAAKLDPADRLVGPGMSLHEFTSRVRALAPLPGARLWIEGEPHKLLAVSPGEIRVPPGVWHDGAGGTPLLGLADGAVRIDELQPPGKRPMSGAAWRRGRELPSAAT